MIKQGQIPWIKLIYGKRSIVTNKFLGSRKQEKICSFCVICLAISPVRSSKQAFSWCISICFVCCELRRPTVPQEPDCFPNCKEKKKRVHKFSILIRFCLLTLFRLDSFSVVELLGEVHCVPQTDCFRTRLLS